MAGGFERLLHKIYKEKGAEGVKDALEIFGFTEEEEEENEQE